MDTHKPRVLNVAGGSALVLGGIALVAYLGDWLLAGPVDAVLYIILAPPLAAAAGLLGVLVWTWGRQAPPFFAGSTATRFFCLLAIVLSSLASTVAIPAIAFETVYRLYRSDPIGVGDDVGRGPCTSQTYADVSDRAGLVASVRETTCSGTWDGNLMYFVFVHAPGVPNSRDNLVYRYAAEMGLDDATPAVRWIAPAKLRIFVSHFVILETTLQRWEIGGAAVGYEF